MQQPVTRAPSVQIAFRSFGRTLRHGYENLFSLGLASIIWSVIALPVIFLAFVALQVPSALSIALLLIGLLIVPLGPATAALHRITQRMTEERSSSWTTFWSHFRADWGWSSRLVLVLIIGFGVWQGNQLFYANSTSPVVQIFSGFFLVANILWLGITFFAMPVALRQTSPQLGLTLRNTAVLVIANLPGAVVSLILVTLSCVLLLVLPPLFLLIPGWIALWSEENVRLLLVASGIIPPDEFADRD